MATEMAVFAVRSAKPCFAGLLVEFVNQTSKLFSLLTRNMDRVKSGEKSAFRAKI